MGGRLPFAARAASALALCEKVCFAFTSATRQMMRVACGAGPAESGRCVGTSGALLPVGFSMIYAVVAHSVCLLQQRAHPPFTHTHTHSYKVCSKNVTKSCMQTFALSVKCCTPTRPATPPTQNSFSSSQQLRLSLHWRLA